MNLIQFLQCIKPLSFVASTSFSSIILWGTFWTKKQDVQFVCYFYLLNMAKQDAAVFPVSHNLYLYAYSHCIGILEI